jgi:diguanylate cyclase (GGDEF)-like protein
MVHELTRRQARAVLLAKMGKLLQSSTIIAEAIPIVLGFAPKIFPEFRAALLLLNASRRQLEVVGTWTDCNLAVGTTFETDSCWALRTGQKHFVEENDATARNAPASMAKGSYLCIPIMTQGGAVGILHLEPKASTRELSETALLLISSLVEQVGLSISNLKLQEALQHQSIRDALTGIFNRRHLEETLEREIRRAARTDQPVGATMFDLDHFKTFNDTFGHEAGDTVLRELGTFLARSTRAEDTPCRFGGEEVFMILPGADLEGARSRAERLRVGVRGLSVTHQGKPVGRITISVGVAGFPAHGQSVSELIAAADAALYQAKNAGRDRVVLAELGEETESGTMAYAGAGI